MVNKQLFAYNIATKKQRRWLIHRRRKSYSGWIFMMVPLSVWTALKEDFTGLNHPNKMVNLISRWFYFWFFKSLSYVVPSLWTNSKSYWCNQVHTYKISKRFRTASNRLEPLETAPFRMYYRTAVNRLFWFDNTCLIRYSLYDDIRTGSWFSVFWLILIHRLTAEFAFNSLEQTRTKTYKKINMNPYRNVIEGVSSD